jgi:hypothetical protein
MSKEKDQEEARGEVGSPMKVNLNVIKTLENALRDADKSEFELDL